MGGGRGGGGSGGEGGAAARYGLVCAFATAIDGEAGSCEGFAGGGGSGGVGCEINVEGTDYGDGGEVGSGHYGNSFEVVTVFGEELWVEWVTGRFARDMEVVKAAR